MVIKEKTAAKYLFVVSDATGMTAEQVVRATLTQFHAADVALELVPKIETSAQLRRVVTEAKQRQGLIAYTLVSRSLRSEIVLLANEAGVPTVDLIGPLLTSLIEFLSTAPAYQAGLYTEPSVEHYKHLDASRFTVRHDDGQGLHELGEADVVIVGPSRTSKTPLSVYLAHTRGLKVANVPLALGVEPFEELESLDGRCVVALTMSADLLSRIRHERKNHLGAPGIEYSTHDYVERELRFCHQLYRQHPSWSVIDVTGRSIEEIAANVCSLTIDAPRE